MYKYLKKIMHTLWHNCHGYLVLTTTTTKNFSFHPVNICPAPKTGWDFVLWCFPCFVLLVMSSFSLYLFWDTSMYASLSRKHQILYQTVWLCFILFWISWILLKAVVVVSTPGWWFRKRWVNFWNITYSEVEARTLLFKSEWAFGIVPRAEFCGNDAIQLPEASLAKTI